MSVIDEIKIWYRPMEDAAFEEYTDYQDVPFGNGLFCMAENGESMFTASNLRIIISSSTTSFTPGLSVGGCFKQKGNWK